MRSTFTDDEIKILSAGTVRIATLVEFHFDPIMRYWNGRRDRSFDGVLWKGTGELGGIEGLEETRSGESQQVTFTLSGTDETINREAMKASRVHAGVLAIVYVQLMDQNWAAVNKPNVIWSGVTQPLQATRLPAMAGETISRSIKLPAENAFYARDRAPLGLYTHLDQLGRVPGDLFLQFQSRLQNYEYYYP